MFGLKAAWLWRSPILLGVWGLISPIDSLDITKDGLFTDDLTDSSFIDFSLPWGDLLLILESVWSNLGDAFDPLSYDIDICLLIRDALLLDFLLFILDKFKPETLRLPLLIDFDVFFFPKTDTDGFLDLILLLDFAASFSWLCRIWMSRFTGFSLRGYDWYLFLLAKVFFLAFLGGA